MNREVVKKILMSMRTTENERQVNNILGKIDLLSEEKLQSMIMQIGNNEESIRKYLEGKLRETQTNGNEQHTPINDIFTYGTANNCVHLHMPVDLHPMISQIGIRSTVDTVNLYLLDAIERIRNLQNDGFYKFKDKESIYMISPILVGREMRFLQELDFQTRSYARRNLQNEEFLRENPEALFAVHIFGKETQVGIAQIGLDVVNSERWQNKRKEKVREFAERGILLRKDEQKKE